MENKKLIRFVNSLVVLPIITISIPLSGMPNSGQGVVDNPQAVLFQTNTEISDLFAFNQDEDPEIKIQEARIAKAKAIDAYYESKKMPLLGYGMKMVEEAEKNDLDWRLLPAISVIETTGGKNLCKKLKPENNKNPFGWGSCKLGFKSFDDAIETVARNLGGNNPKTAHHYDGKTTDEIIDKYNPPSIVPKYKEKIKKVMNAIGAQELSNIDSADDADNTDA